MFAGGELVDWAAGPLYQQVLAAVFVVLGVALWLQRAYKPFSTRVATARRPRPDEVDEICKAWDPEPLAACPNGTEVDRLEQNRRELLSLASRPGPRCHVQGFDKEAINLAGADFLGLVGDERVADACTQTLQEYGTGSCGPRGFYGTTAVHLDCEAKLTDFFQSEESILYSFGPATASSTIPAFAKKGDLIVADEGINFSLQSGVTLSRAEIRWFAHNDMTDLVRVLEMTESDDRLNPKLKYKQRRFLIVEAVYGNYGDIAPMETIMLLKRKFNFRVLIDESFSVGVLGKTGRGVCEHYGIHRGDIDIMTFDAGNALVSVGGACVGSREVVGHQRLSGAGYCFSASQPPFLATAIIESIRIIETEGGDRIRRLRDNIACLRNALLPLQTCQGVWITSDPVSPLIVIRLKPDENGTSTKSAVKLQAKVFDLQEALLRDGLYVSVDRFVEQERRAPPAGIKLLVSSAHSLEDLRTAGELIKEGLHSFLATL